MKKVMYGMIKNRTFLMKNESLDNELVVNNLII